MKRVYNINDESVEIENLKRSDGEISFSIDGKEFSFQLDYISGERMTLSRDNQFINGIVSHHENILYKDTIYQLSSQSNTRSKNASLDGGAGMVSPMPGKIFKILVSEGDEVKKGDKVLILEAMKMEHAVVASKDGTIEKINFNEGELVDGGVVLASLKADE